MRVQKFVVALILSSVAGSTLAGAYMAQMTKVYFIPFEVETYVPVTMDSIACAAHELWLFNKPDQDSHLREFLSKGPPSVLDEKRIRVMIASSSDTFYIDSDGNVRGPGSTTKIDAKQFKKVLRGLGGTHKVSHGKPFC